MCRDGSDKNLDQIIILTEVEKFNSSYIFVNENL